MPFLSHGQAPFVPPFFHCWSSVISSIIIFVTVAIINTRQSPPLLHRRSGRPTRSNKRHSRRHDETVRQKCIKIAIHEIPTYLSSIQVSTSSSSSSYLMLFCMAHNNNIIWPKSTSEPAAGIIKSTDPPTDPNQFVRPRASPATNGKFHTASADASLSLTLLVAHTRATHLIDTQTNLPQTYYNRLLNNGLLSALHLACHDDLVTFYLDHCLHRNKNTLIYLTILVDKQN